MLLSEFERFGRFLDPWREFERMRNALFGAETTTYDYPVVNLWSKGDSALLTAEIPGVEPGSIDISIVNRTLTLKGSREEEKPKEGESYHRRERRHGKFAKTVELPFNVEAGKVKAGYSKGVLTITLPRAEVEKPKKIEVKSG